MNQNQIPLEVIVIPAFEDNLFFVVHNQKSAMVVDPGSAKEVIAVLKNKNLKLETIVITHHHHDHIGGVTDLKSFSDAKIIGPDNLSKYGILCDIVARDGILFEFNGIEFKTISTPGHTHDHLIYYSPSAQILFCGDTLFSLGCGRLFEGTPLEMYQSLAKIKNLPAKTQIYCAHEYTEKNARFHLDFMKSKNAEHADILFYQDILKEIQDRRKRGGYTIPTALEFELKSNLFLKSSNLEVFTEARMARNIYS